DVRPVVAWLFVALLLVGGTLVSPVPAVAATVSAGADHSLAVKADGSVLVWGNNASGQLGDGTTSQRLSPFQLSGLSGVWAVAAGKSFSLALTTDGTVYAWGLNANGQLGLGNTTSPQLTPVAIPGLSGVVAIAAGDLHALAVKADGTVWAWGSNANGR